MKKSNYITLLLLAVLFAAPGITAYLFYQHPDWLSHTTVNKGQLIKSPLALNALGHSKKWRVIFWSPDSCEKACFAQLDTLARVRLALGRQLYDVDLWLILGEQTQPLTPEMTTLFAEQDFHVAQLTSENTKLTAILSAQPKVLIANPDNYLILEYPGQVNPDDVYKDLKRLLSQAK